MKKGDSTEFVKSLITVNTTEMMMWGMLDVKKTSTETTSKKPYGVP